MPKWSESDDGRMKRQFQLENGSFVDGNKSRMQAVALRTQSRKAPVSFLSSSTVLNFSALIQMFYILNDANISLT